MPLGLYRLSGKMLSSNCLVASVPSFLQPASYARCISGPQMPSTVMPAACHRGRFCVLIRMNTSCVLCKPLAHSKAQLPILVAALYYSGSMSIVGVEPK